MTRSERLATLAAILAVVVLVVITSYLR